MSLFKNIAGLLRDQSLTNNTVLNNTVRAAASEDTGLLARGATGQEVRDLQSALRARGAPIRVDGIFGPKTEAAVRSFQAQNGAKLDGVVGPETQALLDAPADSFTRSSALREGASGSKVRALQQQLADRGYGLAVDGEFGPQTTAAVRRFQRNAGIRADGVVGPQTRAALAGQHPGTVGSVGSVGGTAPSSPGAARRMINGVPIKLSTAASTDAKFDEYAAMVRAAGGKIEPGKPTILALRGVNAHTGQIHGTTSSKQLDDTIVVLEQDRDGTKHVRQWAGSTHPGQTSVNRGDVPDVDGDGRRDVGILVEGNYAGRKHDKLHHGKVAIRITMPNGRTAVPGVRDPDHNGVYTNGNYAHGRRSNMDGILIHGSTGRGKVSSLGCFNLSNRKAGDDFDQFLKFINERRSNITVINAYGAERYGRL